MDVEKLIDSFEKNLGRIFVVLVILLILGLIFSPKKGVPVEKTWQSIEEYEYEQFFDSMMKREELKEKTSSTPKKEARVLWKRGNQRIAKVTATVYNPVESQCDSDPLITADNSKIDLDKLNSGQLKWIAISRDLREHFKYGSKVRIKCKTDPSINGVYEVRDCMNPRFTSRIDILKPIGHTKGRWENIEISSL